MQTAIPINNNMITWAIARAGYDLDDFITHKYPKVKAWLSNEKAPTVRQLEEFSIKVHVPFGYLFLDEPPLEQVPIPFFRTGQKATRQVSLNVYDTIMLLKRRQEWVSEYLTGTGESPLPFVGRFDLGTDPEMVAADMRQTLGLHENWAKQLPNWATAKDVLVQQVEAAGIMVSNNGVVENNNTRSIKVEECRGFVLIDDMAPFLFINNNDGKAAQMFTLAHELAHVWLGRSAGFDFHDMTPADDPFEQQCDRIAASFLVPERPFSAVWAEQRDFKMLARNFKVSPIVIARRALTMGLISKPQFFSFYKAYTAESSFLPTKTASGGNFYATQKVRLGLRFAGLVNQALAEGKILPTDAYRLTSLKGDTYQEFIQQHNL